MDTLTSEKPEAGQPQPLEWLDGDMPYSTAFGDHFYCREDGRAEAAYVFLDGNALPARWQAGGEFTIGELGFGTGLNFCETLRQWKAFPARHPAARLHFISFELYPMERDNIAKALSRWPVLDGERNALVARWPDNPAGTVVLEFEDGVCLSVVCGAALESIEASNHVFDAWYLDGFAPSRNPDMWSPDIMAELFAHTRQGGTFATYAAAGFVRRNLQGAGFEVLRRPGFAGKREMLHGRK
jgi:tRNA U34 5-methylaminomethyl-2-thiouridine-forming methyltransferase MnmC